MNLILNFFYKKQQKMYKYLNTALFNRISFSTGKKKKKT